MMGDNDRSKGFGFVEFTEHEHALAALREVFIIADFKTVVSRELCGI